MWVQWDASIPTDAATCINPPPVDPIGANPSINHPLAGPINTNTYWYINPLLTCPTGANIYIFKHQLIGSTEGNTCINPYQNRPMYPRVFNLDVSDNMVENSARNQIAENHMRRHRKCVQLQYFKKVIYNSVIIGLKYVTNFFSTTELFFVVGLGS